MFTEEEKKNYREKKEEERKTEFKTLRNIDVSGVTVNKPYYVGKQRALSGSIAAYLTLKCLEKGYKNNAWLTFKQAKEKGLFIRKGEKASDCSYTGKNGRFVSWQLYNVDQLNNAENVDFKAEVNDNFMKEYQAYIEEKSKLFGMAEEKEPEKKIYEYYCLDRSGESTYPLDLLDYKDIEPLKVDVGLYAYQLWQFDYELDEKDIDEYHLIPVDDLTTEYNMTTEQLFEKFHVGAKMNKKYCFPLAHTSYVGAKGHKTRVYVWDKPSKEGIDCLHAYMSQKGIDWKYNEKTDITTFRMLSA